MKRYAVLFSFLLLCPVLITPPTAGSLTLFHNFWAIVVTAHPDFELSLDAMELEQTLKNVYNFDGVWYSTSVNKQELRDSITGWLGSNSDGDDFIFIYIESHGGGYNMREGKLYGPEDSIDGSRGDPRDEGDEFRETDVNIDFDGDGVLESDVWGGIDECIAVYKHPFLEVYWDDEVREDLATLSYGRLVLFWNGPKLPNSTEGCFSGGFVRDLSAPNRIIITPCNETELAWGDPDPDTPDYTFGYFARPFQRALNPDNTAFSQADINSDGVVSIWEAFRYAWENDEKRIDGIETPQLDDNGDGVADSGDGLIAYQTLLVSERPKSTDINWDARVDVIDMEHVGFAWQTRVGEPGFNPYVDLEDDGVINIRDASRVGKYFGKRYLSSEGMEATGTPEVSVYPNEILVHKYQTFSVDVTIDNVADLYCYEFQLFYDKAVLNCTVVELGDFLEPVLDPSNIMIVKQEYNNTYNDTHGRVWVAVTMLKDEPGKNGGGTLAAVSFNATALGSSTLHLYDIVLGNTSLEAMPVIAVDGYVTVLPTLTVLAEDQNGNSLTTGEVYIDDQLVGFTGSTFTVVAGTHTVRVNDFWGPDGYRYSFTYWKDGPTDNPRTIEVVEDMTLTARYNRSVLKNWSFEKIEEGATAPCQIKDWSTNNGGWRELRSDVNQDGYVSSTDIVKIILIINGEIPGPPYIDPSTGKYLIPDVDCGGYVSGADIVKVLIDIGGDRFWPSPIDGSYSWYTSGGGQYLVYQQLDSDAIQAIAGKTVTFSFWFYPESVASDGSQNNALAKISYMHSGGGDSEYGVCVCPTELKWYNAYVTATLPSTTSLVVVTIHGKPDFKAWVDLAQLCLD